MRELGGGRRGVSLEASSIIGAVTDETSDEGMKGMSDSEEGQVFKC